MFQLGLVRDRGDDVSLVPELEKFLHVDCHRLGFHLLVNSLGVKEGEESEILAQTRVVLLEDVVINLHEICDF